MLSNETKLNYCSSTLGFCCRHHFYNGNNEYGIEECWSLDDAELERRSMHLGINETDTEEVMTLKCYRPQWDMSAKWVIAAGIGVER